MRVGDLVKMYGDPGFYGVLLGRTESNFSGVWWTVYWQSGYVSDRNESLMEVTSESR